MKVVLFEYFLPSSIYNNGEELSMKRISILVFCMMLAVGSASAEEKSAGFFGSIANTVKGWFSGKEKDPVVAVVDKEKIKKSDLVDALPDHMRGVDIEPYFTQLRKKAVLSYLVSKVADQQVKSDDDEIKEKMDEARDNIRIHLFVNREISKVVTDKNLKKAYEEYQQKNPPMDEVHARQILLATEDEAQQIIKQLNEGADFAKLADEKSLDKKSKGGDLGYFRPGEVVKEFGDKVIELRDQMVKQVSKDNFVSDKGPKDIVQTKQGWHVIEVLGARKSTPQSYDEMLESLESDMSETTLKDLKKKLGEKYKVTYLEYDKNVENPVLAKIGDEEIKKSDVIAEMPDHVKELDFEKIYKKFLKDMIELKIFGTEAKIHVKDNDKEYLADLEKVKKNAIRSAYLRREVKKRVKEEDLAKLYEEYKKKNPPRDQVRARHILVDKEDLARKILEQVQAGADFANLADQHSKDKASKGGELGFFHKHEMVPEFSEKAFGLKPGEYGVAKTSFGWHVIHVQEKKTGEHPTFEQLENNLVTQASNKVLKEIFDELEFKADIHYFTLDGKPDKVDEKKAAS
jgi:peptidyl-prolyl cis-trans isomerase C